VGGAVIRRDKPSVLVVRGREDVTRFLSQRPHGDWFKEVAERHAESAEWHALPPAESKTATKRPNNRRLHQAERHRIDCGFCNAVCPVDAVKMPSLLDGYLADLIKTAPGSLSSYATTPSTTETRRASGRNA
jgi:ferredoxin